ncbi:non-ribosomal peptide synthetase [Jongsikchunia kroppenstedtii]|uniref:non-ribosomal peptide synthetase n=1 Tax=Jongsikchunia kroppenstedtii TaxID=1121721 RepID=UPI000373F9CD|nr:non-ribosomal peptide synthetase [Jongsikchunia kroppenstedtii]
MTDVVRIAATSGSAALVFGSRRVSYAEFSARVNDLARRLIALGVGPDVAVGVAIPRSIELLVAVHAVVEAGGHYVPLDVDAPAERAEYMLETARAQLVLVPAGVVPPVVAALAGTTRLLTVDADARIDLDTPPIADGERVAPIHPDDAAYTLFTSGSTGRPKGVTVSHRAIVNRLEWMREWYGLKESDVFLQKTPVTFDVSVWELFLPATVGATLVIAEPDRHGDPGYVADVVADEGVTAIHFVPSMLATFVDVLGPRLAELGSLRAMFTSGEALTASTAQAVLSALPRVGVYNLYGPTEAAVDVTAHQVVVGETTVPIGVPVPSTTTFVLDARLQLVPAGVPGELYLGGVQVARGYAGQSGLTAERFVADPFGEPGTRLYRTGDLVRWNSAGEIDYLGRTDFQVKLRGQRLELGEVESVLASAPGVVHAAADVVALPAGDQLVGYVAPDTVDLDAVRAVVAQALPEYMRPTQWVALPVMPLGSSGKVARRALPRPDLAVAEFVSPATDSEIEIAAIYADVLGMERVSVVESFFDLGGNSLAATRVAARIADGLDVDVSVRDLFDTPSVRELAAAVSGRTRTISRLTAGERPDRLPLSTAQMRMWFINQFDTDSSAYNIPMGLRVDGALDADALRGALLDVMDRHEVLRTVYPSDDQGPLQRILGIEEVSAAVDFAIVDDEGELAASALRGFDVATELPIRARVYPRVDGNDVVVTAHHIAFDGESNQVFVGDLLNAYLRRTGVEVEQRAALPVQYADYALWQREVLGDIADPASPAGMQMAYWREHLAGLPAVTDLPMDRPRPAVLDTSAGVVSVEVDDAVAASFEAFAREHDVTAFMLSHAALAITVGRLAATSDVIIGAPIAGRTDAALADLVGMFVNTLVLRTDVDPAQSISDFVARVRSTDVDAFGHADVQFDDLIEELAPERSTAYQPLVQIAFTHESVDAAADTARDAARTGLAGETLGTLISVAKFDLTVGVTDRSANSPMRADFLYATALFDEDTVRRFADLWLQVVATIAQDPRRAVGDIDVIDDEALAAMRPSRNSTGAAEPAVDGGVTTPRTLVDILAARELDPAEPALICDGQVLSHREFEEKTDRLARVLIERGVRVDDVVAVGLERSIDSVVAVFGVVKSGAAYVPIDPAYPQERIDYMVADSGARWGITNGATRPRLGESGCEWIDVSAASAGEVPGAPVAAGERNGIVRLDNLSYLIYTSGSTGRPKAVGVSNRGIANLVDALQEITGSPAEAPDTRVLHVSSPSFDASVLEMMWSVALGHTLVVAPQTDYAGEALGAVLQRHRVTDTLITPTVLGTVPVERGRSIRNLVTGGEACPPELIARWADGVPGRRMFNFYGPSEATVWSSTGRSEVGRPVTIGHPVRGFAAYVLDARLHPVPRGVVGELYLASDDSLARGYLGRPALTASAFVADPFSGVPGRRMYATGDLVRVTRDGELEFGGRADHQVKINGQRIELGEIEAVLADLSELSSAVVLGVADDNGRSRLVAYVVPEAGATVDVAAVIAAAGNRLAGHMVPHQIVVLDELPVTPGGKLDRAALPAPEPVFEAADRIAPATAAEESLATIVAGLLGREEVSVTDSFFALGGDSIMSIQLASAAKSAGLPLTPRDIFEHKTVRAMAAAALDGSTTIPELAEPEGGGVGDCVLPPIVSWMVDTSERPEDFADFNQSMVLSIPAALTVDDLVPILESVVAAHPMLSARLAFDGGVWRLQNGVPFDAPAAIERTLIMAAPGSETFSDELQSAHRRALGRLDPASGRVLQAAIVAGPDAARLVLAIHHLAVDAVSWPILIEDLVTAGVAVAQGQTPAIRAELTSMRAWQGAVVAGVTEREAELAHWLPRLPQYPTSLGADFDPQRDRLDAVGSVVGRVAPETTEAVLSGVPEAFGGNVNDVLVGALARAVRSWQADRGIADDRPVSVIVEGHGRHENVLETGPNPRRADLSRTVGWFTSLIPMLIDPTADPVHAVKAAKEERVSIPDHGIGFSLLRYAPGSTLADRPLPSIAFNYLGNRAGAASAEQATDDAAVVIPDFLPAPDAPFLPSSVSGAMPAMAALTINASVTAGPDGRSIAADFRYAEAIMSAADAADLADRWAAELTAIAEIVTAGADVGLSPSDVPGTGVTQADLDDLAVRYPGAAIWPLSPLQRGLYFQSTLADDQAVDVYVTQTVLRLGGAVDLDRLRTAADELLRRHRVLASGFVRPPSGAVVAVIPPGARAGWEIVDLGDGLDPAEAAQRVQELAQEQQAQPFDMAAPPLLRVVVVRHGDETDVVITNHHILFDGWSGPLVLADLLALYATGDTFTGNADGRDFEDFLRHISAVDDRAGLEAWSQWLSQVEGPTLVAPGVEATADTRPREQIVLLDEQLSADLEAAVRRHGVTLATALQLAWAVLLSRLTGNRVVTFGETVSGRPADLPGVESMVGLFINTLPTVVDVDPDASLGDVVATLQSEKIALLDYQHLGLPEIAAASGRPIAFDTLTVHESYPVDTRSLESADTTAVGGLDVRGADVSDSTHYPLNLASSVADGRVSLRLAYLPAAFDDGEIGAFATAVTAVLRGLVEAPETLVGDLSLLDEQTAATVDAWSHGTAAAVPSDAVTDLAERRAGVSPDSVAVVAGDRIVDHRELAARAATVARELIAVGVGPDVAVGVCIPRSVEMIVAIHAVLAAGGAFVPIDTAAPADRVRYMADTADLSIVLVGSGGIPDGIAELDQAVLVVDAGTDIDLATPAVADDERRGAVAGEHAAYTIFTSGSTGRPKGVTVSRQALTAHLTFDRDYYGFTAQDAVLQVLEYTFDPAVLEILRPVFCGGRLVLLPPGEHRDPVAVSRALIDHGITSVTLVPSMLAAMAEIIEPAEFGRMSLRYLHTGGEALTPTVAHAIGTLLPNVPIHNQYGPTEATIYATVQRISQPARTVPIGKPVWNTSALVLDSRLHEVPPGMPGELYLGGIQLARGYSAQPALTAERFIADPYGAPGDRIYRTGDLVRWNGAGELEYLGRTDFQVKLRGQRIELGEIETVLAAAPGVILAAAIVAPSAAGEQLVAYVSPDTVDLDTVKASVARSLPEYMRPTAWVALAEMPLNTAGKVSRRHLPPPSLAAAEYVPPVSALEETIAAVFASVLGIDQVSSVESFFHLGGNSLSAMRVVARLSDVLGRTVSVRDLFNAPSVRELAEAVPGFGASTVPITAVTPRPERIPLSFAQQRMWFINRLDPTQPTYNIPAMLKLSGALDVDALRIAVADVLTRHEVLRTSFPAVNGVPSQVIGAVDEIDGRGVFEVVDAEAALLDAAARGFDVTAEWPLRVRLLRRGDDEFDLVVVTHHIGADGESLLPLVTDLVTAYAARAAGTAPGYTPLAVQFADYALWQHDVLGSVADPASVVGRQVDYWRGQLAGLPDVLELPTDRPRPAVASRRGDNVSFEIPASVGARIVEVAQAHGATPFMVVHAALAVLLARLSATSDIVVATPIAGRGQAVLDPLVGMFVNTLVLRAQVDSGRSFADLLADVRATDLDALAHADVPFESVVEALDPVRSAAFSPLAQVLLSFDPAASAAGADIAVAGLQVTPMDPPLVSAQLDLSISVSSAEVGQAWTGLATYATDLFDAATVQEMSERLVTLLDELTTDVDAPVGDLPLMSPNAELKVLAAAVGEHRDVPAGTVADFVAAQIARSPRRPALVFDGRAVSYAEFGDRVNTLARELISLGVGPDVPVAVGIGSGVEMVVAIHAIVAAGGQYVPIDINGPAERAEYMLATAGAELMLVAPTSSADTFAALDVRAVPVDCSTAVEAAVPPITDADRITPLRPDHALYTLFTSGSTGRPKGVTVSHAAATNLLRWITDLFTRGGVHTVLAKTPITFDASVWELFWPLVVGARTVISRPDGYRDPEYLADLIEREGVTVVQFVPSLLAVFLELVERGAHRIDNLRLVLSGGEALTPAVAGRLASVLPDVALINQYGPTESAVDVTAHEVVESAGVAIPIGGPVANTRTYVLDSRLRPTPRGVPGELYLGGAQLARGYAGRGDLTADRFVADPYSGLPGARLYRTGDLVRWNGAGELEYLGRTDFQVKLRGQRMELGEIETVLAAVPEVHQAAAAVAKSADGGEHLVAYVTPADIDLDAVKASVAQALPSYMVPTVWMPLAELALNSSGKLDRRALPKPEFGTATKEIVDPETEVERAIAQAFAEVLGLGRVSIIESFFDLGGNSLSATRVVARVRDQHALDLELGWLFDDATVRGLARKVAEGNSVVDNVLIALRADGSRPPIFCVHPAGGVAWFYGGLAPYLADRPIYGLQDPHVVNGEPSSTDAHELAARYVAEIRKVSPHGPYRILGWSVGGVIAQAMATLLQAEGEEIAFLGVMDARPENEARDDAAITELLESDTAADDTGAESDGSVVVDVLGGWRDLFDLGDDVHASTSQEVTEIIRSQIAGMGLLADDQVERVMTSFDTSTRVVLGFAPDEFRGDLLVFTATEDKEDPATVADGWVGYVTGAIRNIEVPTHHLGMADAESLAIIGPALEDALTDADGADAGSAGSDDMRG